MSLILEIISGFLFFRRLSCWTVKWTKRCNSSGIFSFFNSLADWGMIFFSWQCSTALAVETWGISCSVLSLKEICGTFFADSGLPPSKQKLVFTFVYTRGFQSRHLRASCCISTSRRLVQTSHWLILQWKYRL